MITAPPPPPWLLDYGVQTSRSLKALKVWMALQEHGVEKFGRLIDQKIAQADYLTGLIKADPNLELTFETSINIVCYRYNPGCMTGKALKRLNTEIMLQMQENGVAAVSDATVHGRHCLRVAINIHRTVREDLDFLVEESGRLGNALVDNP
jgi:aromatic-L-amino-acid decarboxylase